MIKLTEKQIFEQAINDLNEPNPERQECQESIIQWVIDQSKLL